MSRSRRASVALQSQTSEPLIVVEESDILECSGGRTESNSANESSAEQSPTNFMNPYLLSPWRDARETRKHSLPTPQCSGITASQVRRLSERSEGAGGPGPRQTEFLATLSTAPAPVAGGRRHSVVTISKVPVSLFGRNRRESVAAFPSPGRILPSRRESITGPPSTEPRGSVHNLQLDIMDDIVQARKVRMKLWNTSSEKVCEVQPLDEAGGVQGVQKYTGTGGRRYSDFVGTTLAPIPSSSKRRASELPPTPSTTTASKKPATGIVCSNTDLISILSSLTSSSMEINQCEAAKTEDKKQSAEQKRSGLKTNRSNSFDASVLHGVRKTQDSKPPTDWFVKRHQPMSTKTEVRDDTKTIPQVTFTTDCETTATPTPTPATKEKANKVVWDGRSGSIVDPQILGNAIEDFLRRDSPSTATPPTISPSKGAVPKTTKPKTKSGWFAGKPDEATTSEACDSSICSTLKDLFVK